MISENDLHKLSRRFAEKINQVTGIHIDTDDIAVYPKNRELIIKAWDCSLARIRYSVLNPSEIEEQVVRKVLKDPKQLRTKIIKCKVYHLSQSIPDWEIEIKNALLQQNVSHTFVNSLCFEVIDHGYKYKQYAGVEDHQYDYPFLAIKIHNQKDFDFSFPINVYDAIDPIDIEFLKQMLFITIIEKNLHTDKHLKDL